METKFIHRIAAATGALGISLFLGTPTFAAGTSSAQFLKLGAGARAAGMGEAFTAVSNDVTAAYYNPAGLTMVENPEISFMQNSGLVDTDYQFLGAVIPRRQAAFAFSLYRLDHGTIDRYTAANTRDGSFDAGSLAASISLSKELGEATNIGFNVKYIQESIESESASTFAGDFGIMHKWKEFQLAGVIQNVGPGIKFVDEKYSLPITLRAGLSRNIIKERLLLAADISKPKDNDPTIHAGLEFHLVPAVSLRGGYRVTPGNNIDVDGITNVSGGLGVALGQFQLDYAFVPFGDLDSTHRISLNFQFKSNR